MSLKLAVVTASLDLERTKEYWSSWWQKAKWGNDYFSIAVIPEPVIQNCTAFDDYVVTNGIIGVVGAFAAGVRHAVKEGADIIACFHDDLRIDEEGWDRKVLDHFESHPRTGLAGFFGARSLGAGDIYRTKYSPMQLARGGCMQNMQDGEKHGERVLEPRRAVCFDGFSQIGRARFMVAAYTRLESLGIIHHGFDSALGAMAIRDGWECYYLPIACHHQGGMTAIGSAQYQEWAKGRDPKGDQGFWEKSHEILYEELRDCLPLWVNE